MKEHENNVKGKSFKVSVIFADGKFFIYGNFGYYVRISLFLPSSEIILL